MSEEAKDSPGGDRPALARVLAGLGRRLDPRRWRRGGDGSSGDDLLAEGRWLEAAEAYRRDLGREPGRFRWHLDLGTALSRLGRWEEAAEAWRRAQEIDGSAAPVHLMRGMALARLERWREAAAASRLAVERDPASAEGHVQLGNALLKAERWEDALAAYDRGLALAPGDPVAQLNRGAALAKLERWEEAASAYRRAVELEPSGEAFLNLGGVLWKAGRLEEAAAAYRRATGRAGGDLAGYQALGAVLLQLERWEEAVAAFGRAARLAPASLPAQRGLAAALARLERWDEVIPVASRASALDPDDPEPHRNLGVALLKAERWGEAASSFRRVVELRPDDAGSRQSLGSALARLGRWEEAAEAHRRRASLDPGAPGPWLDLAEALSQLGRLEEAAGACARAVSAAPGDASPFLQLGAALSRLERWEEAVEAFRQGGRLVPDNPGFQLKLAEALENLGRAQEARVARERAARIWSGARVPADEAASAALRQRAASFWTPENLGAEVFRAEAWLEGLASAGGDGSPAPPERGGATAPNGPGDARLLFVLDDDYGELTTLMYLVLGQGFAGRATLLLPDRLHESNADALPGRTRRYRSPDDVLRAVEEERPQVVFLLSAYLYSVHGNMSLEALERLVGRLGELGCRVVTGDPFLGMLSAQDPRRLIEIDLPEGAPAGYREAKAAQEALLHGHLPRAERILRGAHHLYPAFTGAADGAADARNVSFFNPRLLLPDLREGGPPRAGAAPHWLFVLSMADFHTQTTFQGPAEFVAIVTAKLVEAREAGRHPILIAPGELIEAVIHRMPRADGVDLLRYCSFRRLMALLLTAEHAFYWNVVSHSILIRLFNGLPVILFDKGHLVRNVKPMYRRVVDWYYQGREPAFLDHRRPLTVEALAEHAAAQRLAADRMLEGYRRAPEPAAMIRAILDGAAIAAP